MNRIIIFFLFVFAWPAALVAQISRPQFRYVSRDSVITYASDRYSDKSFLHNLLMGKNYRKVWQQPVVLPVFRLSESRFTVHELGGGMQTKSLKLKDKKGQQWSLRTIDKDVRGAFSGFLKNSFFKDVAQDHISAAMPYAPLVVAALLQRTEITAAEPTIYFIADDPALGPHRSIFANTVCMLEERDPDFDGTDNTEKMLRNLQESNRHIVNQQTLLEARLFDMLIADWDRHYDNWRWGLEDSAGLQVYQPIPRDRDWAFYYSRGLVPKLARLIALRFLINFKEDPRYIKSLSLKAHAFDGAFLNAMNREDWEAALSNLQQSLSDSVIRRAVKKLPPAIFSQVGPDFIHTLTSRRDRMKEGVMAYYHFLASKVQIDGSNDADIFLFRPAEKGVLLEIYRQPSQSKGSRQKIYERKFLEGETHTIMLNGLGNNDLFETEEGVATSIRLVLNGGTGTDTYKLNGKMRSRVNDYRAENSVIAAKKEATLSFY